MGTVQEAYNDLACKLSEVEAELEEEQRISTALEKELRDAQGDSSALYKRVVELKNQVEVKERWIVESEIKVVDHKQHAARGVEITRLRTRVAELEEMLELSD